MTTPQALREAVARAIMEARNRILGVAIETEPGDNDRDYATAAVRIVLDAAVAVCRETVPDYSRPFGSGGTGDTPTVIMYPHRLRNGNECADAIASLRSDSALRPESGEGEK